MNCGIVLKVAGIQFNMKTKALINLDIEKYEVELKITANMILPPYSKNFPFPQAVIYFLPIRKNEFIPVRKDVPISFHEGADGRYLTSIRVENKVIEYTPYYYALPAEDMETCILEIPSSRQLGIKKKWLFDKIALGLLDVFDFNVFAVMDNIYQAEVVMFYKLI